MIQMLTSVIGQRGVDAMAFFAGICPDRPDGFHFPR
mgnify:CR=1 FL=1